MPAVQPVDFGTPTLVAFSDRDHTSAPLCKRSSALALQARGDPADPACARAAARCPSASAIRLGPRRPAPYGEPPLISFILVNSASEAGTPTIMCRGARASNER